MLKIIIKGYSQILSSIIKVLVLLAICAAIGAAFVYPLWYFATEHSRIYTLSIIILIFCIFIYMIIKNIRINGFKSFLFTCLKFIVIAGGLTGFIYLVLNGKRFLSIPLIILMLLLWGFLSFSTTNEAKNTDDENTEE